MNLTKCVNWDLYKTSLYCTVVQTFVLKSENRMRERMCNSLKRAVAVRFFYSFRKHNEPNRTSAEVTHNKLKTMSWSKVDYTYRFLFLAEYKLNSNLIQTYHDRNPGQMKRQAQHTYHLGKVSLRSEPSVVKGERSRTAHGSCERWSIANGITCTTETA